MILGLDTAGDRWHAVNDSDDVLSCGPLEHKRKTFPGYDPKWANADTRREEMRNTWRNALESAYSLDGEIGNGPGIVVCCEYPLSLRNPKTNIMLSLAAGALWDVAVDYRVLWLWVEISKWKKVIVGNGNAKKPEVQAHVLMNYGPQFAMDDNVADAKCILECGKIALDRNVDPATL